jgi:hypothetical protein
MLSLLPLLPSSVAPPSPLSQHAAVSTSRPAYSTLNLSCVTAHSLFTISHAGTLANWLPPPSLCNLTLAACDLSALLVPVSTSDSHFRDTPTASACNGWTHISHLRLAFCIPDQIQLVLHLFSGVTHLHLVDCSMSDTVLLSLLPMLPPHLVSIDLSRNPLSSLHLRSLLSSVTALQSLTYIGCRFSPPSSIPLSQALRSHPSLSSIALQVDGSASAVRLLHAACTRPVMRCIRIEAPYTAASQHVVSFGFPPIPSIESIVIINVPIQTIWLESVLSSVSTAAAQLSLASHSSPRAQVAVSQLVGLRSLRLVNNGTQLLPRQCRFLNLLQA